MPPNMLKAKVGGTISGLDVAVIKRAETAMEELKAEFDDWLSSDVDALVEARNRFAATATEEIRADLFRAGHDIKGAAQTYEFPLIARIAASLCRLIDGLAQNVEVPLTLVDAHVEAIRVVFRQKIQDSANRMALTLTEELEARVTETLEKAR